jgi:hypothetical protein
MEGGASLTDNDLAGEDVLVCLLTAERSEVERCESDLRLVGSSEGVKKPAWR